MLVPLLGQHPLLTTKPFITSHVEGGGFVLMTHTQIKSSSAASQPASQEVQVRLLFCLRCRLVRDEQETVDAPWITQQTYQQSTGIDPTDCLLVRTYCPVCYQY